jgi:hypothetical protein
MPGLLAELTCYYSELSGRSWVEYGAGAERRDGQSSSSWHQSNWLAVLLTIWCPRAAIQSSNSA